MTNADTTAPLAHSDVIVLDYLAALWAESDGLEPDMRDELMSTVADYIAVRRTSPADPIADPSQIVGRLGPPEALVAAVRRGRMPHHLRMPVLPAMPAPRPPVRPAPTSSGGAESAAIALLMAGSVMLPVISPLAAMVMVSSSPRWSVPQKSAAWLLALGAVPAGMVFGALMVGVTNDGFAGMVAAWFVAFIGAFIAGLSLLGGLNNKEGAR